MNFNHRFVLNKVSYHGHCAIEIIGKSLRAVVNNDPDGRDGMALGQYIAGMEFSNVGLGIDHAMAHTLSAYYDVPHGKACAMLLPIAMEFNAPVSGTKYKDIAIALDVKGVDQGLRMNIALQPSMLSNSYPSMSEFLKSAKRSKKKILTTSLVMLLRMPVILEAPEK